MRALLAFLIILHALAFDAHAQLSDGGSGLPSGGSVNDCILNTAPGTGTWQACPGADSVATDTIWDAAGDLAVGSGANTAARLAKGNEGDVLTISGGNVAWGAGGSGMTHPQVMARASIGF